LDVSLEQPAEENIWT